MDFLSLPDSSLFFPSSWRALPNGEWWCWSIVFVLWMVVAMLLVYYLWELWR